jgi:hypothetical protein
MYRGRFVIDDSNNEDCGGIVGTVRNDASLDFKRVVVTGSLTGATTSSNPVQTSYVGYFLGYDYSAQLFFADCYYYASASNITRSLGMSSNATPGVVSSPLTTINNWNLALTFNRLMGANAAFCWAINSGDLVNDGTGYKAYPFPKDLTVTIDKPTGLVKLEWKVEAGQTGMPADGYAIQYRYNSSQPWRDAILKNSSNLNFSSSTTGETTKTVYTSYPEISTAQSNYDVRITRTCYQWNRELAKTFTLPMYPQPDNFTVEVLDEDILQLSWNITTANADAPNSAYNIDWQRTDGSWTRIQPTDLIAEGGSLSYAYNDDHSSTKKQIRIRYPEHDVGVRNYEFRIYRNGFAADETAPKWNGSVYPLTNMTLSTTYNNLNTAHLNISEISGKGTTAGIDLQWKITPGYERKDWIYKLWRKDRGALPTTYAEVASKTVAEVGIGRSISDLNATSCTPYDYKLELLNGETELSSIELKDPNLVRLLAVEGNFEKVSVSKGFYNDRVAISWNMTPGSSYNRYTVERRLVTAVSDATGQIMLEREPSASLSFSFDDNTAIPGVYYYYDLIGWMDCNGTPNKGIVSTNIGYIQPYGIVSGKVTYEGGNAVTGVTIIAENDASSDFANRGLSLDGSQGSYASIPYKVNTLSNTEFSYQVWINLKTKSTGIRSLFDAAGKYAVEIDGNAVWFSSYKGNNTDYEEYQFEDNDILFNGYHHITVTYKASGGTGTAIFYLDGEPRDTVVKTGITVYNFPTATTADSMIYVGRYWEGGNFINGNIDELRLWKKVLSADEVAQNFDSYISGKEADLAAYYRFDEQAGNEIFDITGRNGIFSENHGTLTGGNNVNPRQPQFAPSAVQLSVKGTTDEYGNYLITTIPYTGEGSTVTLTPMLGVHEFNPGNKPMFFNQQSSTYNNVDFTDISAFSVSGYVYYENSNYPVEGATLKIDGSPVAMDGVAVVTDERGYYQIKVPIGSHHVSVELQGHEFVDAGRFPAYQEGLTEQRKHVFNDAISNLNFYDKTKITLVGRVVGGDIQRDKQLGFGLSTANMGAAKVTLKNTRSYLFGISDTLAALGDGSRTNTHIESQSGEGGGTYAVISTDSATGEFFAVLPPIPFEVVKAETKEFDGADPKHFSFSKNSFDVNVNATGTLRYTDSLGNVLGELTVHDSLRVTHYSEPLLSVRDLRASEGAFGDSTYIYRSSTATDTITLYSTTASGIDYRYNYPVFSQETHVYSWEISVFEHYRNVDKTGDTIADLVPKQGLNININNALSSHQVEVDTTLNAPGSTANNSYTLTNEQNMVTLDEEGTALYSFTTGFPNIAGDKLLSVNMNFYINGEGYAWRDGTNPFSAYLLGAIPSKGSNFVTKGPDAVEIVLHDPPGSNSYAYIEQGSITTDIDENTEEVNISEEGQLTVHLLPTVKVNIGFLGVTAEMETKPMADLTGVAGGTQSWVDGNRITKTLTINSRIATSSDPNYVGSMADVYIGTSSNITFGMVRCLAIYPQGENDDDESPIAASGDQTYSLFAKEKVSSDQQFQTIFSYTQDYIINTQIPNTKALRNDLIEYVTAIPSESQIIWGDKKQRYYSTLLKTDESFGTSGTYSVFFHANASKEEKVDEVSAYNRYIKAWENRIAENENDKVNLFNMRAAAELLGVLHNRSFDAGVNVSESTTAAYENVIIATHADGYHGAFTEHGGFTVNEAGFEETFTVGRDNITHDDSEDGTGSSLAFGYELSENESAGYDALTVDIYNPVTDSMRKAILPNAKLSSLHGYVFQTRAGQTTCPYEGGDSTLYYTENGKPVLLSYATFQTEYPELFIGGSKNAVVNNIPSGREATYTIQMQNLSEAHLPVTYQLSVVDNTNPNGLILSIDGMPLTAPRLYSIEYGEELIKTLRVRQSSADILDYEGITLSLSSTCDNIASAASIEAHFIPSSTDSKLTALNTLVNINGSLDGTASSDTAVTFKISEYDVNYRNFADLQLQYKNVNSTVWATAQTFAYYFRSPATGNDTTYSDVENAIRFGSANAEQNYRYSMKNLSDGTYSFRILSRTKLGVGYVTAPSNEVLVIKDVAAPKQFGSPLPAGGILTAEGEVSITFNEDIQSGYIADDVTAFTNIEVKAEKNGADIKHDVALKLTGGEPAATEAHIALANKSFTLEAFFQRRANQAGTLLAHGSDLSLGFNAQNKVVVDFGEQTFVSDEAFTDETWSYLMLAYDYERGSFNVTIFAEASNIALHFANNIAPSVSAYQGIGKLFVGAKASKSTPITANIHEISLWNGYTTANHMQGTKAGNEQGLLGYWQLNEAHGTTAKDKARSRHLVLPQPNMWYSLVNNFAAQFSGANYVELDAAQTGIQSDDDFTLEFWFYGGVQSSATMFSVGDGVLDAEPNKKLSVGFDASGKLVLRANSVETILSSNNYLDSTWHHFALNVLRNGTSIAYLDGEAIKQLSHTAVANVIGDKILLGARDYRTPTSLNNYGSYFRGLIDEVRIWRASLTGDAIRQNTYSHLEGTESGLVAYYPFNKLVYGEQNLVTTVSTVENFAPLSGIYTAAITGTDTVWTMRDSLAVLGTVTLQQANAPTLTPLRLLTSVAHTFTANNNKIILNITESPSLIENTTLEISVRNILDLNGNQSGDIRWTAFVHRNRLLWNEEGVSLVKEILEPQTFTAIISNQSGQAENWTISNLPSWLSVNASSGTLQPLTSRTLTFTVSESTPVGSYEEIIYLSGSQMIDVPFGVSLRVTSQLPEWDVNPADFENSMSLIGRLQFEGRVSEDADDVVAAFIDGQCVGKTSPQYFSRYDAYFVVLDIYGNGAHAGKAVTFKAWDASTGETYPSVALTPSTPITFTSNTLKGSMTTPIILNGEVATEQTLHLNSGWSWISLNTRASNMSVSSVFAPVVNHLVLLKNKTDISAPNGNGSLSGTLTTVEAGKMYKVKMNQAATLTAIGDKLNPQTEAISLVPQWNWMGYIPTFPLPLSDALADLDATEGDLVKGQSQFAVYTDGEWVGSLQTMAPGMGYIYQSQGLATKQFHYPAAALATQRRATPKATTSPTQFTPVANNLYSGNMSIIAVVKNGNELLKNVEVGVFAGTECRGAQAADAEGLVFLSVAGEQATALTLKVYDGSKQLNVTQTLTYTDDAIVGTIAEPYVIQLSAIATDVDNISLLPISLYPNPTTDYLYIACAKQISKVEVVDMSGRVQLSKPNLENNTLNVSSLPEGVYMLRLTLDSGTKTLKFTKR